MRPWKEQNMLKRLHQKIHRAALGLALLAGGAVFSGCQSPPAAAPAAPVAAPSAAGARVPASASAIAAAPAAPEAGPASAQILREGDTVAISFPGAPSLNTTQTIRRDGQITLETVGELKAAGLTPPQLQQQLLKAYDSQLVDKEVSVVVQTSAFTVYVTGAVMRPGKIISNRVETPLEAVIEAGIDPVRSNLKKVVVLRENETGKSERFILNLKDVMDGKQTTPFILKSMDKIIVPEKFSWL
jgi:polysaccharide biosynthesis/export protein